MLKNNQLSAFFAQCSPRILKLTRQGQSIPRAVSRVDGCRQASIAKLLRALRV